eukprot:gene26507-33096_t
MVFESNFVSTVLNACPLLNHLSLEESFSVDLNQLSDVIVARKKSIAPLNLLKVGLYPDAFEYGMNKDEEEDEEYSWVSLKYLPQFMPTTLLSHHDVNHFGR